MKIFKWIASSSAFIAPIMGVMSCAGGGDETTNWVKKLDPSINLKPGAAKPGTGQTMLSVMSDPDNPRFTAAATGVKTALKELGYGDPKENRSKAQDAMNTFVSAQIANSDGVIIAASEAAGGSTLATADTNSKPYIAYDRFIVGGNSKQYKFYVSFNNEKVGALQGAYLLNHLYGITGNDKFTIDTSAQQVTTYVTNHKLPSVKNVLALAGSPQDNNSKFFFDGATSLIYAAARADSNLKLLGSGANEKEWDRNAISVEGWKAPVGKTNFDGQLSIIGNRKVDAVLAPNDVLARDAVIPSLNAKGLDYKSIYITGQDATNATLDQINKNEGQSMTVHKPDSRLARIAVAALAYQNQDNDAHFKKDTNGIMTIVQADKTDIKTYIKNLYPDIQFVVNDAYKDGSNLRQASILLTPIGIDKDNLNTYFEVK